MWCVPGETSPWSGPGGSPSWAGEATTPETLRVAAELRRRKFDHARLGQVLFENGSLASLRVLGMALDRVVHVPEADLVWTYVTQADLVRASVDVNELDDVIDVVR